MSETQLIITVLLGAFGVGALWLWAMDRLYTLRTGKPASERVREKNKRFSRPMSRALYVGLSTFWVVGLLFFLFASVWTHYQTGWDRVISLVWVLLSGAYFYELRVRWRRQQRAQPPDATPSQLSGPAR